jgi:4-nitrophenyl phosphatase
MAYELPQALNAIHALIIDMDGVLWRGNSPLPGLSDFFSLLRQRSIRFRLATNNPTRTPVQYVEKLASMGVQVAPAEIITSALVTADYLAASQRGASMYVIGQPALRQVLLDRGLRLSDGGQADCVVVGLDPHLCYDQLSDATLLIRAGARFIGCNPDVTLPSERGLLPGNGATLAFLQASTGVAPVIIGKPERAMFDAALAAMGTTRANTASLGDRLETDILGARNSGLHSILVLSGATDRTMLATSPVQPDWVFDSIQDLTAAWRTLPT